ncbi:MAG: sensor histidine kinase [Planctomycetaceae bacterium]
MSTADTETDPSLLIRKIEREKNSRAEAERLLEDKSRELYVANEKVREQYESIRAAQGQLVHSEKMASVGQLAAGVAHEINNPIGFVTSNVQTLTGYMELYQSLLEDYVELTNAYRAGDSDKVARLTLKIDEKREAEDIDYVVDDTTDLLKESRDGLVRVREIVQNLKSFVHLDQNTVQTACVNEGLEATLKVVWNELKYKCTVERNYGEIPQIRCFAGELNQVFLNLLVNAGQAIDESGTILIATDSADNEVFVHISDTGRGIPPENIEKLFDPFFSTKSVGEGTGLGLSVSYGIVEKHNGQISVDSVVGEGTTFTVRLPISGPTDQNSTSPGKEKD